MKSKYLKRKKQIWIVIIIQWEVEKIFKCQMKMPYVCKCFSNLVIFIPPCPHPLPPKERRGRKGGKEKDKRAFELT